MQFVRPYQAVIKNTYVYKKTKKNFDRYCGFVIGYSSFVGLQSADGGDGAEASPMILMGRMHDGEGGEEDDDDDGTMESLNVSSASSFSSPARAGGSGGDDDEIDENTFNIESDVDAEEYVAQSVSFTFTRFIYCETARAQAPTHARRLITRQALQKISSHFSKGTTSTATPECPRYRYLPKFRFFI